MKVKKSWLFLIIFLLGLSLVLLAEEGKPQKEKPEESGKKSLIKKELLQRKKKELGPPLRNIFSLRNLPSRETVINPIQLNQRLEEQLNRSQERPTPILMDIRYIGYIVSTDKIVALIILEGDVLAVEKGEFIDEGIKIGEVTPLAIEIIGPDSEKRKYSLEGEK